MKKVLIVAAVLAVVIIVPQTLFTVDQTKQAIVLQFGDPISTHINPGLKAKTPFLQSVITFEKRILTSDPGAGEYLSSDKKRLLVDHVSRWRIGDPLRFFQAVRNESGGTERLKAIVFSEMRAELALHPIVDIISGKREQIMETVARRVQPKVASFGIDIVDVRIRRADLPAEVLNSVFARMQAERDREAKRYRAEGEEQAAIVRADADRQRTIILAEAYNESQVLRGDGDAVATNIYAEAFTQDSEFYAFLRSLEAYEKFLPQDSTLVLSTDTELFKYIVSPRAPEQE
ncbi:MAG: protease modulator HflC [Dehalococcoidia bacterium]|jgi:membrane protease subunit HflC|nr:protease modulator HflC [Dehalococcoidia bacterium]